MSTALAEQQQNPADNLRHLLMRMKNQIAMAMPKHVTPERLIRVAMTAITKTPRLAECTQGSFMACLLTAAQLGLEPNTPLGHGWLIPRRMKVGDRKVWTCTWQTGYQGLIELAFRSGLVLGIDADVVREGDHFIWEKGLEPKLEHRWSDNPEREDQCAVTHAWGVVRIRDAAPRFEVLTFAKLEKRRKVNNDGGSFSPWNNYYDEMAKKTAIIATLKYAPKSAEMQRAAALEDASDGLTTFDQAIDSRIADALRDNRLLGIEGEAPTSSPQVRPAMAAVEARRTQAEQDEETEADAKPAKKKRSKKKTASKKEAKSEPDIPADVAAVMEARGLSRDDAEGCLKAGYELDLQTGELIPPEPGSEG